MVDTVWMPFLFGIQLIFCLPYGSLVGFLLLQNDMEHSQTVGHVGIARLIRITVAVLVASERQYQHATVGLRERLPFRQCLGSK